jgi:putative membrane protein
MWGYGHDMSAWAWWAMSAGMILFWGLVLWGVIALARYQRGDRRPQDLLDERFARGELDEETYRRQRDLLHR